MREKKKEEKFRIEKVFHSRVRHILYLYLHRLPFHHFFGIKYFRSKRELLIFLFLIIHKKQSKKKRFLLILPRISLINKKQSTPTILNVGRSLRIQTHFKQSWERERGPGTSTHSLNMQHQFVLNIS